MMRPRAFAILFEDLHVWSVGSFFRLTWQWPKEYIKPLSVALKRRTEEVDRAGHAFETLQLVTLPFDGNIVPRENSKNDFKGKLFFAYPNDVVYSKIDVRNGAIGTVPEHMSRVAVSSEFPVYEINSKIALPLYVKLLFHTSYFKQAINSMISGASGRKRVQPAQLEKIDVPFPPLHVQQAIVDKWQRAQEEIRAIHKRVAHIKQSFDDRLLKKLGLALPSITLRKGAFALEWKEFERWDTFFYREDFIELERQLLSMKHARLGEALNFTSRSWKTSDYPDGAFEYVEISSVTKDNGIIGSRPVEIKQAPSRATTLIKEGDIILATTRPYLGAFAIVPEKYNNCVCSSGFSLADSIKIPDIEKEFLLLFLKSPAGLRQMERRMTGGLYPAIVQDELEKILVPIPSRAVQQEIIRAMKDGIVEIEQARVAAEQKSREIKVEIEALILGTKRPVV